MKPDDHQNRGKSEDRPEAGEKPEPNLPENRDETDLKDVAGYLRSPGYARAAELLKKCAKSKPKIKR